MNWKIRIIHLTHTDIGYKDIQTKVKKQLRDDLLGIIEWLEKNPFSQWVWNIECFGTVEDFLRKFPELESRLASLVKSRRLGLSAAYWNFSKIAGAELIKSSLMRYRAFCDKNKLKDTRSLITNDVNGYARSWAEEAFNLGIDRLYFGLHTHHGLFPVGKKQTPFWWQVAPKKQVLVWIGEQYAFGNDLGVVPGPMGNYIAQDGLNAGSEESDQISLSLRRLGEYLVELERSGYPVDIVPITVLGHGSDDDPPNFSIEKRLDVLRQEWKKIGVVEAKMCTLEDFFDEISTFSSAFPIYSGEWPDWWTDGTGAMPGPLRAFREAQRNYKLIQRIDPKVCLRNPIQSLEDKLLAFAEHTFGSEDTIRFPHGINNFTIESIKKASAFCALEDSYEILGETLDWKSSKGLDSDLISIEVFNPYGEKADRKINVTSCLGIRESEKIAASSGVKIYEEGGSLIPFSIEKIGHPVVEDWSAKQIWIYVTLPAKSKMTVVIDLREASEKKLRITHPTGGTSDLVDDVTLEKNGQDKIRFREGLIRTKRHAVSIDPAYGISQITLLATGHNLLKSTNGLLQPLYIVDPVPTNRNAAFLSRREIGRNRFGKSARRYWGRLSNTMVDIEGENAKIVCTYDLPNFGSYELVVELSNHSDLIHAHVNLSKDAVWGNESLLLSLPFSGDLLLEYDRTYAVSTDQLPGSLVDYHSVQEGLSFGETLVAQLDSSLVWTGSLTYGERRLASKETINEDTFSWVLNNAWETNFPVDASGFHGFRYVISAGETKNISEKLLAISGPIIVKRLH